MPARKEKSMDRLEATFRGTIADLRHKRPETAGTAPGTKLTLDTDALEPELAVKLFQMENGHPVQITISEIQDRLPMGGIDPTPQATEDVPTGVPRAFHLAELDVAEPELPPDDPTRKV